MKRIGIIVLLHESNTFLPSPTTLQHFKTNVLVEGEEVLSYFRGSQHEVGGFIDSIEQEMDLQLVGVFAARAMPYGSIDASTWNELMRLLASAIDRYGPYDGLLVAPHGATVAENAADADGVWLEMVRSKVGPGVPMIGTFDLHANVSAKMTDATNALFGYRTNPHLDQHEQGMIAGKTLIRTLRAEIHPKQYLAQLPLCVNIERQATAEPQCRKLMDQAARLAASTPGLIDISCVFGFPYADVHEMGASVVAVAENDLSIAKEAALAISQSWYEDRHSFVGELIELPQAVERAIAFRRCDSSKPVGLLDMGDNVGGGSPGDGTSVVHQWMLDGKGKILTVIADEECVVQSIQAGVGCTISLSIGGKNSPSLHGPPILGSFLVKHLSDGRFVEKGATHGGYSVFDQGPTAVLEGENGLTVIATTHRVGPMSIQQVLSQNLEPRDFEAIVIKGVHAPVAAYAPYCGKLIRVNTNGATTADLTQLTFRHRRVPMFPWEDLSRVSQ
jgi:microcystin degradation protein MlrC